MRDPILAFFTGLAIGLFVTAGVLGTILDRSQLTFRVEAVERGYAEWITETDGSTTWQWKDEQRLEEQ